MRKTEGDRCIIIIKEGKTHLEVYPGGIWETQHTVSSQTTYIREQTDMVIRQQMYIISIILVTATILRSMFHQFLTNMVATLTHLVCKAMFSHNSLLIQVEVDTNLVVPLGDSHQILTRSRHGEVTVTIEEEEGILVITINNNNNNGMVKVDRSTITHEDIAVSIIVKMVETATAEEEEEEEEEEVITMIRAKAGIRFLHCVLDIDIKHNATTPDHLS